MAACGSQFPRQSLTLQQTQEWLHSLFSFTESFRDLCNAHTVEFFTHSQWKNVVPSDWKPDLLAMASIEECCIHPSETQKGSLQEFLRTASRLRLPTTSAPVSDQCPSEVVSFGMTLKKSHEVDRTSCLVADTAHVLGLKQVLDLGSGKGYLSQHLSLHYGLTVVGMDSQDTNTEGAQKRNKKVYKAWKSSLNRRKSHSQDTQSVVSGHLSTDAPLMVDGVWVREKDSTEDFYLDSLFDINPATCTDPSLDDEPPGHHSQKATASAHQDEPCTGYKYRQELHDQHSFFPVTQEVREHEHSNLLYKAEATSCGNFSASEPCCLVGLHTCGDLAATTLRLFCELPSVRAVCVVGCCYHHITENDEDFTGNMAGFPLSSYLKSLGAHLGRTARMLACQSIHRIKESTSGTALQSVFFRAVLQVLLERELNVTGGESVTHLVVGKLRHFPSNFEDYVRIASKKIGMDFSKVSNGELQTLHSEFLPHKQELQKFLQLRVVMAACIESLIVLDRLLYLLEKDYVKEVSLVQLFEPLLSPRCFGIIAWK